MEQQAFGACLNMSIEIGIFMVCVNDQDEQKCKIAQKNINEMLHWTKNNFSRQQANSNLKKPQNILPNNLIS